MSGPKREQTGWRDLPPEYLPAPESPHLSLSDLSLGGKALHVFCAACTRSDGVSLRLRFDARSSERALRDPAEDAPAVWSVLELRVPVPGRAGRGHFLPVYAALLTPGPLPDVESLWKERQPWWPEPVRTVADLIRCRHHGRLDVPVSDLERELRGARFDFLVNPEKRSRRRLVCRPMDG